MNFPIRCNTRAVSVYRLMIIPMSIIILGINCHRSMPIRYPQKPELIPLHGRLLLYIQEHCQVRDSVAVSTYSLHMGTETIYPYTGNEIVSETRISEDKITTIIQGVYTGGCLCVEGPATYETILDLHNGNYSFDLIYRGKIDRHKIMIKSDRIEISGNSGYSRFMHNRIWRFPERSFVCRNSSPKEVSWICEGFIDTLRSVIHLEEIKAKQSGKWPYHKTFGSFSHERPSRFFRYEQESDFYRAGEILEAYAKDVLTEHPGCLIEIKNWTGKKFISWNID